MFGKLKSFGNKAISVIPGLSSKIKINIPQDQNLQQKLNQISNQILKSQISQQFKVYQQLISIENANFNRNLRIIYQWQGCTTETINCIIRFYSFLLTNCKNQLVICKLVSQPLVIQLTKIVLKNQENPGQNQVEYNKEQKDQNIQNIQQQNKQQDNIINNQLIIDNKQFQQSKNQQANNEQNETLIEENQIFNQTQKQISLKALNYLNPIDWDQVNAYKVALIRSYINCINAQTINYMIIQNQLPIFVNCINGYKHYLTDGVEGTCISNCILMILIKVNHNDQVCNIIFDPNHNTKNNENRQYLKQNKQIIIRQKLTKSISRQKSIKLDQFLKHIIKSISNQITKIFEYLNEQISKLNTIDFIQRTLIYFRKLDLNIEFIQSNILFCIDLINSINNYNYTFLIKESLREVIEKQLIDKIIQFIKCQKEQKLAEQGENKNQQCVKLQNSTKFHFILIKIIKCIVNLSIVCQKQQKIIKFLNQHAKKLIGNILILNQKVFYQPNNIENINQTPDNTQNKTQLQNSFPKIHKYQKQCLTYLCDYTYIILKQTISPSSRLASRKKLQINEQIRQLKQIILEKIFNLLEQINKYQRLKQKICYKTIRNLLLTIFYLTIKQDKCTISSSLTNKQQNLGLLLDFKYNILLLHKIFCLQFKKTFSNNKNWQFIVNNYETLMRQIPNTILSVQENDKYCHYHNNNNQNEQDQIRNRIMICQAVRNYRYMIIHETKLENRLIRLENIYHKHFISPGWNYQPGQIIKFNSIQQYKIICNGFLINNITRFPIQILQDFQCLLITHKQSENTFKIIANIRYKKINSFIPENKNIIRMKLIGVQQLILEFSTDKNLTIFKEYLNQNRNKTRQKQLKFINYYLNMYYKDTQQLIQQIYQQDIIALNNEKNNSQQEKIESLSPEKQIKLNQIQIQSFQGLQNDQIPQKVIIQKESVLKSIKDGFKNLKNNIKSNKSILKQNKSNQKIQLEQTCQQKQPQIKIFQQSQAI